MQCGNVKNCHVHDLTLEGLKTKVLTLNPKNKRNLFKDALGGPPTQ